MEKHIDESVVRITAGVLQTIQCLVLALEATQSLNREALEIAVASRLRALPDDDLTAVPLAMMAQFLRPADPPPPILRLVKD